MIAAEKGGKKGICKRGSRGQSFVPPSPLSAPSTLVIPPFEKKEKKERNYCFYVLFRGNQHFRHHWFHRKFRHTTPKLKMQETLVSNKIYL